MEKIPAKALKLTFESGQKFTSKQGDQVIIDEEVKPGASFKVQVDFVAPPEPGHFVGNYAIKSNDLASRLVCGRISCDIQVSDEKDVSVMLEDMMDMSKSESQDELDQRLSMFGIEREARAPRESMAPGAQERFNPNAP